MSMRLIRSLQVCCFASVVVLATGCSGKANTDQPATSASPIAPSYFHVDAATAGSISGSIRYTGKKPARKLIDMSEDPACVAAHHEKAYDESLIVDSKGRVGNAFVYIEKGLEGKNFEVSSTPVAIDQRGCWFRPRVLGIQIGQVLQVVNSDPVTHNIHPMAHLNREWNHSQGPGDAPLSRKFTKTEIMIPVKCNIHSWMHAFIGVLDHPYFTVSKDDGAFEIKNLPSGTYTIAVWQENLGTQEQQVTVGPSSSATANFTLKGK
jgi:plastocyanin